LVLGTARIIERVGGLILALMISRRLGADGLGTYATVFAYFGLIAQAGEAGATNLLVREIARDKSRTSSYVSHTSVMAVGFSAVLMAIAWIVIPFLGYSHELQLSLQLIVLAVAPGTLNTIQEAVFVAHQRVEFETVTTFISTSVFVLSGFVLLETGHGIVSLVSVFVCVEYAVTIFYYLVIARYIAPLRFEFQRSTAAEILRELKGFTGSSVLGGVFARPEVIMLSLFGTQAQVGYYSGAARIVDIFQFVPQVYMTNVFPYLSRSYHEQDGRAQRIQDVATKHLLAVGLPVSVGLFCTADRIIPAFYGDGFGAAVVLLRILSINVVLYCVHAILWRVLAARGEQNRVFRIQLISTTARLGIGAVLISTLKAVGAAVTVPISFTLQTVLFARAIRRDGTHIQLGRLAWRFAAAAGLMGVLAFALDRTVSLWAVIPAAAAMYLVLVVLLRAFSPSELAGLRTMLPTWRSG
jgi:O-antigen/teichoic acid export membrane protein